MLGRELFAMGRARECRLAMRPLLVGELLCLRARVFVAVLSDARFEAV